MILSGKKYGLGLIITSFFLLVVSKALAGTFFSTFLSILMILALGLSLLGSPKMIYSKNINNYLFWIYILVFLISLFRQFILTDLSTTGFVNILLFFSIVIVVQLVALYRINPSLNDVLHLIYYILNSYIVINLAMYVMGFEKDRYAGINTILGFVGINIDRVFFYLSPSMAYFAMLCGISCIVTILLYLRERSVKYLLGILISITALLLTDSRGPIFGLVIILFFIFGLRKFWIKYQIGFFIFFIFSVNFFITLIAFINRYVFDIEQLSRAGNTTLLSLREIIWKNFFDNYDPSLFNFLFGYGNVGQKISGISSNYKHLFVNWPNPEEISLHNNTLQMLVDIGAVGSLCFFIVLYGVVRYCIKLYKEKGDLTVLAIPAIVNYLLLLGFSDIIINISNIAVFFVLILIIVGVLNQKKKSKPTVVTNGE